MSGLDRNQRLFELQDLFERDRILSRQHLLSRLGISRATLDRDIKALRDEFRMPISFDRDRDGYRLAPGQPGGSQIELPHLFYSAEETQFLITLQYLAARLDSNGMLGGEIRHLMDRLNQRLADVHQPPMAVASRVQLVSVSARAYEPAHFQTVGAALLQRKRLFIRYHGRSKDEDSSREISPQRLMFYRDNWYLDAWCHLRDGLRAFALDAITEVRALHRRAIEVDSAKLDAELASGYGIFSGSQVRWAELLFSADRARWVAQEQWHPKQQGHRLPDGRYHLRLPYAQDTELIMDILRHGSQVQVLNPPELRQAVIDEHRKALETMTNKGPIPNPTSCCEVGTSQNADMGTSPPKTQDLDNTQTRPVPLRAES